MTSEAALYRRVIRIGAIAVAVTGLLGAGVAGLANGREAAVGAAMGGAAALVVAVAGPAAMLFSHRRSPWQLAFSVASAWLAVILTVAAVFASAGTFDDAARLALVVTFGCGVLVELVTRVILTVRARVPYVEPGSP